VIAKDTSGIVESIRQLRVARKGAVKARSAAQNALTGVIVSAPDELRHQLTRRKTTREQATLCLRLRPDQARLHEPAQAAKATLRSLARRIAALDTEIDLLDRQLEPLVAQAAPRTIALLGIGTDHAGQLLTTAGQNIDRLKSEASFAALCAANPIPVSSGRTNRHRINYGGDRDANRALHMIAVYRLRYCPRSRAYADRRQAGDKTKTEIIRCLKRYIAREVYYTLRADLLSTATPPRQPRQTVAITCGTGPIGTTVSTT
jgi:transposase